MPRTFPFWILSLAVLVSSSLAQVQAVPPLPEGARHRFADDSTYAHSGGAACVVLTPDGKSTLTSGSGGFVKLWDIATGKPRHPFEAQGGWVCQCAVSPDGKLAAGVGYGSGNADSVHVWDVKTGKVVHRLPGHVGGARSVTFSPDGKTLVSGGFDRFIRVWDLATGKQLRALAGHSSGIPGVCFAPDGKTLASAGYDGTLRLWDPATGKALRQIVSGSSSLYYVTYSPDGRLLLSGGDDNTPRLWESSTGKEVRRFAGHSALVHSLAFSRDGRTFLSGSYDNTARLWEVASGKELRCFKGHTGVVWSVALTRDGLSAVTASGDGCSFLWELSPPAARKVAKLTPKELEALWAELAGLDAAKAHEAVWTLSAAPQAAPFLGERLKPAAPRPGPDPRRVAQLIADLDADDFEKREKATQELTKLGSAVEAALVKAVEGKPPLEMRRRLERLLEMLEREGVRPEELRIGRALRALELAGTPEARKVLEALAKGDPEARLTAEARAALARLGEGPSEGRREK